MFCKKDIALQPIPEDKRVKEARSVPTEVTTILDELLEGRGDSQRTRCVAMHKRIEDTCVRPVNDKLERTVVILGSFVLFAVGKCRL